MGDRQGGSPRTRASCLSTGFRPENPVGGDDIAEEEEDRGKVLAKLALVLEVVRLIVELLL